MIHALLATLLTVTSNTPAVLPVQAIAGAGEERALPSGSRLRTPAPALLAAWVVAVDADLARSIGYALEPLIDGQQRQQVLVPALAALACLVNGVGCNLSVHRMHERCDKHCADDCDPYDPDSCDPEECRQCCFSVSEADGALCLFTCGVDRPEEADYNSCWQHSEDDPPAGPGP